MRRFTFAALMGLALISAAACSGCQSNILSNDKGVLEETVVDQKVVYAAEAALFGANSAAEAAVDSGLLKAGSPLAIQVADHLDTAKRALDAARSAQRAGDAKTFGARISESQRFVAQAWAIIPVQAKKDA